MSSVTHLLLLLLCSYHSVVARAGDDAGSYKVLAVGSPTAEAVCAQPQVIPSSSSGARVLLSHRYGPCSPAPLTEEPSITELLRGDQLRAEYVQRKFNGVVNDELNQSKITVPTNLGAALGTLQYVITVGIGTPAVTQNMMIDTGSDVSWVHCSSTTNGSLLFDPVKSSTYAPLSCTSAPCTQLGGSGCSSSQCQYMVTYADGSSTNGTYGSDTLALTASETVTSFNFGCSHDEEGFDNNMDGLMGLGGGEPSLVSQTAAKYGKAFSYCLPATSRKSGFLTLGAPSSTSGFVTTTMLRSENVPTLYGILLQDIAVGGELLGVSPTVFAAGSVMDSGTLITRLPAAAYSALSSAFKAGMTQYPSAPPVSLFDTCFDLTGQSNVLVPAVALVFDGSAVVDLDVNGIMVAVDDGTLVAYCLAFSASSSSVGIIGNVQQRTYEVLHDVDQGVFGFGSGAC